MDINNVVLVGRLTQDPELKMTKNNKEFCRFSIASNRDKETVGFYDCVAWGKTAEIIAKHLSKGRRIGVTGSLWYSSWKRDDGKTASKVEIMVNMFQFLDSEKKDTGDVIRDNFGATPVNDDGIPF